MVRRRTSRGVRRRRNTYYPLSIGEVLADRYRIEHKLGWGGYSTVWMAQGTQENKAVALKIMNFKEGGEKEYNIQTDIIQSIPDLANLHIIVYEGTFYLPDAEKTPSSPWCCLFAARASGIVYHRGKRDHFLAECGLQSNYSRP